MKEARLGDDEDEDADLLGLAGGLLDTPLSANVKRMWMHCWGASAPTSSKPCMK